MFNRKLREEVERLKRENEEKDKYISILREKIKVIEEYESKMPEDCVYGDYCEVCQFVKVFHMPISYAFTSNSYKSILVCGKSEVCPNFVKKSDVKGVDK